MKPHFRLEDSEYIMDLLEEKDEDWAMLFPAQPPASQYKDPPGVQSTPEPPASDTAEDRELSPEWREFLIRLFSMSKRQ